MLFVIYAPCNAGLHIVAIGVRHFQRHIGETVCCNYQLLHQVQQENELLIKLAERAHDQAGKAQG
jgi:hypothetical protein